MVIFLNIIQICSNMPEQLWVYYFASYISMDLLLFGYFACKLRVIKESFPKSWSLSKEKVVMPPLRKLAQELPSWVVRIYSAN